MTSEAESSARRPTTDVLADMDDILDGWHGSPDAMRWNPNQGAENVGWVGGGFYYADGGPVDWPPAVRRDRHTYAGRSGRRTPQIAAYWQRLYEQRARLSRENDRQLAEEIRQAAGMIAAAQREGVVVPEWLVRQAKR